MKDYIQRELDNYLRRNQKIDKNKKSLSKIKMGFGLIAEGIDAFLQDGLDNFEEDRQDNDRRVDEIRKEHAEHLENLQKEKEDE